VAFRRTSAFVAAASEEELATLDVLQHQALDRNIPVYRLSREEALMKEPHLGDSVLEVLELPTTGIVTPWEVAIALAEEAVLNGISLNLQRKVVEISTENVHADSLSTASPAYLVTAVDPDGGTHTYHTRRIIDAAGVYADQIYGLVSKRQRDPSTAYFTIRPRKGEYFVLDHEPHPLVERVIYPVPSDKGKGVLVVPTIHNNLLIGPNSDFVDDKDDVGNTTAALDYVRSQISKTVKDIPFQKVIRNFSGLRPTGSTHDFIVEEAADAPGFYLAAAIESPGLTAAPAIAEYIIQELLAPAMTLTLKETYRHRTPMIATKELSPEAYNEKIRENPAYGHILCRCEQISEGEILDAIHRPAGARTIKGIRKRCRPGMGRCQGGFCEPLVTELLCRELSLLPDELLHIPADPTR
jgi:glycerol-3-phosphate dehydrogenase